MKTLKSITLLVIVIISPIIAKSQFFVELNTGYAAPLSFIKYNDKHLRFVIDIPLRILGYTKQFILLKLDSLFADTILAMVNFARKM